MTRKNAFLISSLSKKLLVLILLGVLLTISLPSVLGAIPRFIEPNIRREITDKDLRNLQYFYYNNNYYLFYRYDKTDPYCSPSEGWHFILEKYDADWNLITSLQWGGDTGSYSYCSRYPTWCSLVKGSNGGIDTRNDNITIYCSYTEIRHSDPPSACSNPASNCNWYRGAIKSTVNLPTMTKSDIFISTYSYPSGAVPNMMDTSNMGYGVDRPNEKPFAVFETGGSTVYRIVDTTWSQTDIHSDVLNVYRALAWQDIHNLENARPYIVMEANVNQVGLVGHHYIYLYKYYPKFTHPIWCFWCNEYEERKNLITYEDAYLVDLEKIDNVFWVFYYTGSDATLQYKVAKFTEDWIHIGTENFYMKEDFKYGYKCARQFGVDNTCRNTTVYISERKSVVCYGYTIGSGFYSAQVMFPNQPCGTPVRNASAHQCGYPNYCTGQENCEPLINDLSPYWNKLMFWNKSTGTGTWWDSYMMIYSKLDYIKQPKEVSFGQFGDIWFTSIPSTTGLERLSPSCFGSPIPSEYLETKFFIATENFTCTCSNWVAGQCYEDQRRYTRICRPMFFGVPCDDEEKFEYDPICENETACPYPTSWRCYDPDYLCLYDGIDCEWQLDNCLYCTYGCNYTQPMSCYPYSPTTTIPTSCENTCPSYMLRSPPPECECYCEQSCFRYVEGSCECEAVTINTTRWREDPIIVFADLSEGIMVLLGSITIPLIVVILALSFASIMFMIMKKAVPKV